MALIALGINHDTASVEIREKVAFAPEQMVSALHSLCRESGLDGAVILSTCNRTEIIASGTEQAGDEILHWLAHFHALQPTSLSSTHYSYQGSEAIAHMMRVAAGLDSLVLGEPQILGQMKSAYAVAQEAGTVSRDLNRALQHTFNYAKRVRTETAIGENPVSVAFAAVSLSQRIFADLSSTKALLIGAGETIDLVARHLLEQGVGSLIVANRTLARAEQLASQYRAEPILLSDIPDRLQDVDIVISSTASQLPILGKGAVERAIKKRKHRPIFMVDIAVPRDIEPEVGDLRDVYLYTVDDLGDIISENKKARQNEVVKADIILKQGVDDYASSERANQVVPIIRAYRQQAEETRDQEVAKALKQLANGQDAEQVIENLGRLLTNKLIHTPSANLKKAGQAGQDQTVAEFASLFDLQEHLSQNTDSDG
ncbi:Glutamyl-tRNA reductase [BD1-7 clade bacterium]|uniref:Glutamyl-tRNA reductase n=1 Tax=BD1-7 clade bacterium TaxID=2029982 RepID=A0A5S9MVD0_9GAMM|nr:Glutamyl-tRNA reductase [BD1-7 clade bacterium]